MYIDILYNAEWLCIILFPVKINRNNFIILLYFQEREKELDVRNIYSNRVMRPPHRLGSTASSPAPSNRLTSLRPRKKSDPQLTPRQKAKLFERKRRDDEKRLREVI